MNDLVMRRRIENKIKEVCSVENQRKIELERHKRLQLFNQNQYYMDNPVKKDYTTACYSGNLNLVRQTKCYTDHGILRPLKKVAILGHLDIVKHIISRLEICNPVEELKFPFNKTLTTAFTNACIHNHADIALWLLELVNTYQWMKITIYDHAFTHSRSSDVYNIFLSLNPYRYYLNIHSLPKVHSHKLLHKLEMDTFLKLTPLNKDVISIIMMYT